MKVMLLGLHQLKNKTKFHTEENRTDKYNSDELEKNGGTEKASL